jgi:hypothetical protein
MEISGLHVQPAPEVIADVDRIGDEIAEFSAHLEAATAHLLDLAREFDVREGWNHGFRSCAHWLAWRASMDLGAARDRGAAAGGGPGRQRRPGRADRPRLDEDGMVVLRGRLTPEQGAVLMQVLAAARETLYQRARVGDAPAASPGVGWAIDVLHPLAVDGGPHH